MRAPDPASANWAAGLAAAARAAPALAPLVLAGASLACSNAARPPVAAAVPAHPSAGVVLSSYRAPPGCPDERTYVQSVESRAQTLRLRAGPGAADAADRLRIRIQADSGSAGWLGQLEIEGAHALEREVRGERCEDVALALALIAVLRLDAGARPEESAPTGSAVAGIASDSTSAGSPAPPTPPSSDAIRGPRAQPGGSSASQASDSELEEGVLLPDSAVRIVRSRGPRRAAAGAEPRDTTELTEAGSGGGGSAWQPSLAAHLGYVSAPSHALQARLRAELQLGPRPQSGSVALGLGYAGASDQNASADLDFALLGAQLDVCPLALGSGPWLRACAVLSGGLFAVSARALDDDLVSQSSTRAWAGLGPSLEVGFPLGSRWTLRALAEGSFLLVRDSFEVERIVYDELGQPSQISRTLLYHPPFGSLAASLGLGYAF